MSESLFEKDSLLKEDCLLKEDLDFQRFIQASFVKGNRHKFKEITDALEAGDITQAHRLVHSLKSNAGQVGKTVLQKAAADVERLLVDGKNLVTEGQMKVLETELAAVLNALLPLLDESGFQTGAGLPAEEARALIEQLEPMLKMCNPECLQFTAALRQMPETEELIRQMEDYNFVTACELLGKLKTNQQLP